MPADLTLTFDASALERQLHAAAAAFTAGDHPAIRRGMHDGAVAYLDFLQERYLVNASGGGDWPADAESTSDQKRRDGQDDRTGFKTGDLYRSLAPGGPNNVLEVSGLTARAGSADPKLPYFQAGNPARHQPPRPVVVPPDATAPADIARRQAAGAVDALAALFGGKP